MVKSRVEGSRVLRNVLVFTLRHWAERKWLVFVVAGAMMLATLTEIIVPVYAGRLVDALAQGRDFADVALHSFLVMAGLGLTMVLLRHLAWWSVVPLTLGMMRKVSQNAFHRVQRFSTDWHNNSFAGSVVRKITRGMWALDMINDVLLLALLPVVGRAGWNGGAARSALAGHGRGDGAWLHRLRSADGDAGDASHRSGFASI